MALIVVYFQFCTAWADHITCWTSVMEEVEVRVTVCVTVCVVWMIKGRENVKPGAGS